MKQKITNIFLDAIFNHFELFFSLRNRKKKKSVGRPKKYSDKLIFELGLLKYFLGIDTENKFLKIMRDSNEYKYMGDIPSNSVFKKRFYF